MKEVSCKALDLFFAGLRDRPDVSPEALVRGTAYSVEHVRKRSERIEWSAFARILENALDVWSEEELEELGARFVRSPALKGVNLIGQFFLPGYSPGAFYRWIAAPRAGAGNMMFTCVTPSHEELGPGRARVALTLDEGYACVPAFFHGVKGSLAAMPELFGLQRANVDMQVSSRGAVFDITYPIGNSLWSLSKKAALWPFVRRDTVRAAHEELLTRYQQLEHANTMLQAQSTKLETAKRINAIVHRELDLDNVLSTVVDALVEQGGYAAARVALTQDLASRAIDRSATAGDVPGSPQDDASEQPLVIQGRSVGNLRVWPTPTEQPSLVDHVLPAIATAIANALAHAALEGYSADLARDVRARTIELEQAHAELESAMKDILLHERSREQFLANVHHELRTPMTLVNLALGELEKEWAEGPPDRATDLIGEIRDSNRRLLYLVDNLLRLAAAQRDELRFELSPTTLNVAAKIRQSLIVWTSLAGNSDIALAFDGPESCLAHVDERAVETILTNLVSNALKYTPNGGHVWVSLRDVDEQLELVVRDDGVGMSADDALRAFERLEQGTTPPVRHLGSRRGMGIGLALVKELVESHGGSCAMESQQLQGTTVRVVLPRGRVELAGIGALEPAVAGADSTATAEILGGSLAREDLEEPRFEEMRAAVTDPPDSPEGIVLVAEDDSRLARHIATHLSERYEVVLASNGVRALALAERVMPDILVTDLNMPEMGGLQLAERFRGLSGIRQAPVLVISAFGDEEVQKASFRAGAVEFLAKPFEGFELVARVRALLAFRELGLRYHQREKLAALGRVAGRLAHELRNPTNVLVNGLGALDRHLPADVLNPGAPAFDLIEVMQEASERLRTLCGATLDLVARNRVACAPHRCDALVSDSVRLVSALESVTVRTDLRFTDDIVCAGPLIQEVLMNLLDNAAHAAGPRGWVEVSTALHDDQVCFEVRDNGPGVPVNLRERIFEPLFTTKPVGQGTGLGLANARRIIMEHGGTLELAQPEGPTCFRLMLPRTGLREQIAMFDEVPATA